MLIKKGLAKPATKDIQDKVAKESKERTHKQVRLREQIVNNKFELEKRIFTIKIKAGDKGQIYGGVHEKDIIDAIHQKTKIMLQKHQVDAHKTIKERGVHEIKIRLGQGITVITKINIESL